MYYSSPILLLIVASGAIDGALGQSRQVREDSSPPFVDDYGFNHPAGYNPDEVIDPQNRPSDDFRPITEYPANETRISDYPYYVKTAVVNGNLLNPDEAGLKWEGVVRYGVVISKNYVLWSGSMCDNCTFIVTAGGKGEMGIRSTRQKAKPILHNDDWKKGASSETLILLKLTKPIEFGATVQPVQLPELGDSRKSGDRTMLVGPPIFHGGHLLNLSNRTVLNQQDCNNLTRSFTQKRRCRIIPPLTAQDKITEVPAGSICAFKTSEIARFKPSYVSTLFIQKNLVGIGYRERIVLVAGGSFDYVLHYDITYYRNWIKNITGV